MADEPSKDAVDVAEQLAAIRKERDELKARGDALEKTLAALARQEPPASSAPVENYNYRTPEIPQQARERLKAQLGWNDADVDQHWKIIGSYFSEMAQPFANALGQLADGVDYTRTRLTTKDYEQIEEEVEKEFKERLRSGRPASRKELTEVVRSRKLPELVQQETERRLEAQKSRGAQSSAATTEGSASGGMSATRPTQAQPKSAPLSKETFEKLSIEDKEKALDGVAF